MRFTEGKISRAIGSARTVSKVKFGAIAGILDLVDGTSHWYSWEMKNVATLIALMLNAQVETHHAQVETHHSNGNETATAIGRVSYYIEVHSEPVITIAEDDDATWHVTLRGNEDA